jgi:hypothetical protein
VLAEGTSRERFPIGAAVRGPLPDQLHRENCETDPQHESQDDPGTHNSNSELSPILVVRCDLSDVREGLLAVDGRLLIRAASSLLLSLDRPVHGVIA